MGINRSECYLMSEPNPYFVSSLLQREPEYAGFWIRFLASFLDCLVLMGFACASGIVIVAVLFGVYSVSGTNTGVAETVTGFLQLINFCVSLLIGWLYHAFLESSEWQATLGKKWCGLRVCDSQGERLTFVKATIRYVAKFISGASCYVGYFMAAFTGKKQALHDIIAGTLVVKVD